VTPTTDGLGAALAERLNLSIIGNEGHDLKGPCPNCPSSDAFRLHADSGVAYCYSCGYSASAFQLAEKVLGDREAAKSIMVELGIFEARHSTNGHCSSSTAPAVDPVELVAKAKGVTSDSLRAFGTRRLDDLVTETPLWTEDGKLCGRFQLGAPGDKDEKRVKGKLTKGSNHGLFLRYVSGESPVMPQPGETYLITEGVKDAAKLHELGYKVAGLQVKRLSVELAKAFRDVDVTIVPDRDIPGEDGAKKTARALQGIARSIRLATLPTPIKATHGDGVREVVKRKGGEALLRAAIENAVLWDPHSNAAAIAERIEAKEIDPATTANQYLDAYTTDKVRHLVFWRGTWHRYQDGRFRAFSPSSFRAEFVRWFTAHCYKLTTGITSNVLDCLRGLASFPSWADQPTWRDNSGPTQGCWSPAEILVARNGLAHLPSFLAGDDYLLPPTPQFFSASALDFDFDENAPTPRQWLQFLNELWPDDAEAQAMLQDWFGYLLTPDTSQQKMLVLIGPKRSGKGTIARVLRGLIGAANVAGPTLASLGTNFGLAPLLGKSLAVISDARLSGRTDSAIVVERLLAISGEDVQTVDRKYAEALNVTLPARLMILTNELPRLTDASGALASRMLLLHLERSFYGKEDRGLTNRLLAELPGILLWAIKGWQRLNARGHFVQPASGRELLEDLDDITSPIGAFVKDRCVVGPEWRCPVDDLFAAWRKWCESIGRREAGTVQTFGRDLKAAIPSLRMARPREGASRYRAYDGIGLAGGY